VTSSSPIPTAVREHEISAIPNAPHARSPTHNAAVGDRRSEADARGVDAWLTQEQTHVVKIASHRAPGQVDHSGGPLAEGEHAPRDVALSGVAARCEVVAVIAIAPRRIPSLFTVGRHVTPAVTTARPQSCTSVQIGRGERSRSMVQQ
jgi:hypothetical protein